MEGIKDYLKVEQLRKSAYIVLCSSEYFVKYMKEIEMKGSQPVKDHSGPGACLHIS